MEIQYYISIAWLIGFLASYWMLGVEHAATTEDKTNGEQTLQVIISLPSWLTVFWLLIKAWSRSVKTYWSKPVKPKKTN